MKIQSEIQRRKKDFIRIRKIDKKMSGRWESNPRLQLGRLR